MPPEALPPHEAGPRQGGLRRLRRWLRAGSARARATRAPADGTAPAQGVLSWMGKLLRLDEPTGWSQAAQYQRLLDQLQNSANILNQDERVHVRWARMGTSNRLAAERCVHLDPDGLVHRDGTVDPARLEALTGRVYLASTLCSTVHPDAWEEARQMRAEGDPTQRVALGLWEALEIRHARDILAREWAGFRASLAAEATDGAAPQPDMQAFLDGTAHAPHAEAAATGMAWNLLHTHDPVDLPPAYASAVAEAAACIAGPLDPARRSCAAFDAATVLVERLGVRATPDALAAASHDTSLLGAPMVVATDELAGQVPADDRASVMRVPDAMGVGMLATTRWQAMEARGCEARYARRLKALQPAIRRVLASLLFNNVAPAFESYGHRRGELDEGNLHKLLMDDDRVMLQRDVRARKSVAVTLLIDESGSMGTDDRCKKARDVAITLYEALRQVHGLSLAVYGHTTTTIEGARGDALLLQSYVTRGQHGHAASMMRIGHHAQNLDSWAALAVANQMLADARGHDRRLLFVISDGTPAGHGYGGRLAMEHMRKVVRACEARGVEIYGLGVDNAFSAEHAALMYGPGRCVVLQDVESSVPVITRFLRQVTRAM